MGRKASDGDEHPRILATYRAGRYTRIVSIRSVAHTVRDRGPVETRITRLARSSLPTAHGDFTAVAYSDSRLGVDHVALVHGDVRERRGAKRTGPDGVPGGGPDAVLARVHSECLTGESFGSRRCDCGEQLTTALRMIADAGRGVLVYLRGHEGRGIGLGAKIAAYALQDQGRDTLDANLALGLPGDAREYGAAADILADLGVAAVRLLTNNPDKVDGLVGHGVEVTARVPLSVGVDPVNVDYLRTKRDRMHHDLPDLDDGPEIKVVGSAG